MPVRRLSLLALVAACVGCTPAAEKQPLLTLSVASIEDRTLAPGAPATINVFARTVEGETTTPAGGAQVTLTVTDGMGTVDSPVTLDANGRKAVTFTMCTADNPKCLPDAKATVTGTVQIDGKTLTASTAFSVKSGESATCADDGHADCAKSACLAKACTANGDSGHCTSAKACETGVVGNTDYQLSVTLYTPQGDERSVMRAPVGGTPFKVKAKVTKTDGAAPVEGVEVTFASTNALIGTFAPTADVAGQAAVTVKTDATGTALAFFKPDGKQTGSGQLLVSAAALDLRKATNFSVVRAGTLVFSPKQTDPYYRVMGVQTSGYREQNLLRFQLLDSDGNPFVGKADVKFSAVATGGVTLFPAAPATAPIDENGEVTVTLYSGQQASTVAVTATATIGETTVSTTSDTIAIVGAKPSGTNFAVNCEVRAIPSLMGNDCAFMRIEQLTSCTAVLGDRFNNKIGRDARVSWSTEGGLFGPPSFTPAYNPDQSADGQTLLGFTQNRLTTLNTPVPRDVAPMTSNDPAFNEQSQQRLGGPTSLCPAADGGPRTFNPRDGLNTFIVHTQGEEGFVDANQNGKRDADEQFYDLGEPYVDANDNNQWDAAAGTTAEEYYVDVNGNGRYDGPNGVWDSDTTIWATGHIVFTGAGGDGSITWNPNPFPSPLADAVIPFSVRWEDQNMNEPASTFTTYSLSLVSGGAAVVQLSPAKWADFFGSMDITQVPLCNAQHICKRETRIAFNRYPRQQGLYTAPGTGPFKPAVIQATAQTGNLTVYSTANVPAAHLPLP